MFATVTVERNVYKKKISNNSRKSNILPRVHTHTHTNTFFFSLTLCRLASLLTMLTMRQICCRLRFTYLWMLNQSWCFFILPFYLLIAFTFRFPTVLLSSHHFSIVISSAIIYVCICTWNCMCALVFFSFSSTSTSITYSCSLARGSQVNELKNENCSLFYAISCIFSLNFFIIFGWLVGRYETTPHFVDSFTCPPIYIFFRFHLCRWFLQLVFYALQRSTSFDCWLFDFSTWKRIWKHLST